MNSIKSGFSGIQFLRFVAALMVVCCHSTFYAKERLMSSMPLYLEGRNGVPLFFVISGFVIFFSTERLHSSKAAWKTFALKRIIRIVPLYWSLTFAKLILAHSTSGLALHTRLDFSYVVKSFLFIPDYNPDGYIKPLIGVGWTLNLEMFFYFLVTISPFLRIKPILFLAVVLIPAILLSLVVTDASPILLKVYSDPIIINFLLGMFAGYLVSKPIPINKTMSSTIVVAGLFFVFFPAQLDIYQEWLRNGMIYLSCFAVVFFIANLEKNYGLSIPKSILFMGAASYSLYLVHPLISPAAPALLRKLDIYSPSISILLSIILAVMAACLSYILIETNATKFLNKLMINKSSQIRVYRLKGDVQSSKY